MPILRLIAITVAATVLAACGSGSDDSGFVEPAPSSPLYEAAKKDGKVVVYETVTPDVVDALKKGFEARYPGVEVEAVRLPDAEMIPRLETELGSNAPTADVVQNGSPEWLAAQAKEGAWAAADQSPQATGDGDFDAETYVDEQNHLYELGASVTTFAWNTDLVPDGLKDYTDLLDPKLSDGKVGVIELASGPGNEFYTWLEKTFDESTYTGLGAQKPRIYPSTTGIIEALSSGEIYAANWTVPSLVEQAKEAGAPIDYAMSPTGTFGLRGYAVVNAKAAHPHAAQLYLDFLLSKEGQQLLWPTASSVVTPAPEGVLTTNDQLAPRDADASSAAKVEAARTRWDGIYR